jgi:hypothetical protein
VPPRLHPPGKLGNRRGVNSLGGLTYLTDSLSGTRFLVDTGAAVSVLSYTGAQSTSSAADGPSLAGAYGTSIKSWGKIYKSVSFGGRHFVDVPFVQAAVNKPILGADFFSKHKLLVDTAGNRVLDAATRCRSANPPAVKVPVLSPHCLPFCRQSAPSWRNFPAWSATVPTRRDHSMASNTPWKPRAGRYLQKVGGWIQTSFAPQRKSSEPWRKQGLSAIQIQAGAHLSTWFPKQTVPSGPVETTAA